MIKAKHKATGIVYNLKEDWYKRNTAIFEEVIEEPVKTVKTNKKTSKKKKAVKKSAEKIDKK